MLRSPLRLLVSAMKQRPNNREAIIPAIAYIWLAFYALAVVHSFVSPRQQSIRLRRLKRLLLVSS